MNGRERLFAILNGEKVDHVPVWLLFPYHRTNYYADVRNIPCYSEVQSAAEKYAITLNRRNFSCPIFTSEVKFENIEFTDQGDIVKQTHCSFNGTTIISEIRTGTNGTKIKKLLNSVEDIEFFCNLPVETDLTVLHHYLDKWRYDYLCEKSEFPEDLGSMMLDLGEPISALYGVSNLEELAIASVLPDTNRHIINFLNNVQERFRIIYRYCTDHNLADVYFMVGSELAAPPMFSIDTFKKWILPFSKELIAIIHSKGAKVIQHFHGQIKELLPFFVEMAADGLHTIEAPPIGNCTFTDAYRIVGDKITLIGNIQYDDFRALSQDEMRQSVLRVLDETKGRRFILSPSAGPFDENPEKNFINNYLTFIETAWNYHV
jgi:hypothetical protein